MAVGDTWKITCNNLYVRSEPTVSSSSVGIFKKGDTIVEIGRNEDGSWIECDYGWVYANFLELVIDDPSNPSDPEIDDDIEKKVTTITENTEVEKETSEYIEADGGEFYESDQNFNPSITINSEFAKMSNVSGVFGLPYQFLPDTDPRIDASNSSLSLGYEYTSRIITQIPLLFITPGKARFMADSTKTDRQTVLEFLVSNGYGTSNAVSVNDLINSSDRYYKFSTDVTRYYQFVNPMCRLAAQLLGIDNEYINGTRLGIANWGSMTSRGLSSILTNRDFRSIPFYVDTDASISESFGNTTTQSMIASTINSISDMGRELNFLFGGANTTTAADVLNDPSVQQSVENVNSIVNKLLGSNSFFSNLATQLTTVAAGGKLMFPEIWSDSSFSRSYTCELKFIAPDPSNLSVYLNVLVPLFHLLGFVMPQSTSNDPNSYMSPFIVRASYKGFFNVDLGIISDMSVTRGAECQWTPDGIPTSMSVSITIKDLYQALSITPTTASNWKYDTLNNMALMDYIMNLCGINVYNVDVGTYTKMWLMNNGYTRIQDWYESIWGKVQDNVQNIIMDLYR